MIGPGDKLAALEDATILENGERIAFTIKTSEGRQMRVNCSLAEIGDIFSFLGQAAKEAGMTKDAPSPPPSGAYNHLAPVPAQGIGFQAGQQPDSTLLVMRLFGFDMAFEVPSSGLVRLADDIARIARTLSASGESVH